MQTSDLVRLLASEARTRPLEPPWNRILTAACLGIAAAFVLMLMTLRLRPDLGTAAAMPMFWGKLLFTAGLAAIGLVLVHRSSVPASAAGWLVRALPAPVLAMWLLGAQELAAAPPAQAWSVLLGQTWTVCPALVTMLAVPVFVATTWAMRGLAPTRLRLAGAAAGLFSGAAGAAVYSLHCPEMAAAFVGTWYLLGMLLPAGIGAVLGPRLLRW